MVVWTQDWKSLFMVQNVWYTNGPPSHLTLPFEYRTLILSGIQMNLVFRCWVFRWLLYYNNQFMAGITVVWFCFLITYRWSKTTLLWRYFACSCILVRRKVNTIVTRVCYLCPKKNGVEKGETTSAFKWKTDAHIDARFNRKQKNSLQWYLPLSFLKWNCIQSDITRASFCCSGKW